MLSPASSVDTKVFTAVELARLLGKTDRGIRKRAAKEGWQFEHAVIKGKTVRVYPFSSLPESVQFAIAAKKLRQDMENAGVKAVQVTSNTAEATPFRVYEANPQFSDDTAHHQKKQKAVMRADLIQAYVQAKERAKAKGKGIVKAAQEFCRAYNSGLLLPEIHAALGNKSRPTLERWVKAYRESGHDRAALVDRHGHRAGASKVTEQEMKTLFSLLLHQNRIKIGTAINLMRYIAQRQGWEVTSSDATLRRYINEFKAQHADIWTLSRNGEKALRDEILPYIERDADLLQVGDVLVADGHRLNARVINPFTGKPVRAALVLWLDWASRDVAGFNLMIEEDIYAIHSSLYRAILRLGKMPKAVLLDNGKAFKAKVFTSMDFEQSGTWGLYRHLGILTSFAWPYNARSKPIERFFGTMGLSFERMLPSFVGADITDKPARLRRNEKFMQELSPEWVPTIPEMCDLLESWLSFYRSQPHRGLKGRLPGEVFEAGRGPGIDPKVLRDLMTFREIRHLGRNGVTFMGCRYWHESLYGLREKVLIRYDIQDLNQVWVYDMRGNYLGRADRVEAIHPMQVLRDGGSYPELKHEIKKQRDLAKQTKKVVALAASRGETQAADDLPWNQIVESNPKLPDQLEGIIGENEPAEPVPPMPEEGLPQLESPGQSIDPVRYIGELSQEELDAEFKRMMSEVKPDNEPNKRR